MNKRKLLISVFIITSISGMIFAATPFVLSLYPGEHLPEGVTEITVSDLQPNSLKLVQLRESRKIEKPSSITWQHGSAILVAKDTTNDLHVYFLPTWENKIIMPYRFWGQHEGYCSELEIVKNNSQHPEISCKFSDRENFLTKQWRWSIKGENLGADLPDLITVIFRIRAGKVHAFLR